MEPVTTAAAPLDGLLVADFSRVLAGPLATMHLADLGARVIKVERPGSGDETRSWGPPHSATGTTYFESVNRNKESLLLDLRDPADVALAVELARRADVLVENFRPGSLPSLGLGPERLAQLNPRLVTVSISGFGTGAGAHLAGYDFVVQAVGGLMDITGEADGAPQKVGVAVVDVLCGKDAALGALAALVRRGVTGRGSHVEVNLLSSLQTALVNQVQGLLGAGAAPRRAGDAHPSIAPYELLACADGPLALACGTDAMFRRLCEVLGAPALADDPRFATNTDRVSHRPALRHALETRLAAGSAARWAEELTEVGVPAGCVATVEQGLQLAAALGLDPVVDVVDDDGRAVGRAVRSPLRFVPEVPQRRSAPPRLGQHDAALRAWLRDPTPRARVRDPAETSPAPDQED
ncbi:CaiB/BaiF CoA transferase family protein [Quadrisphaera sp. KR29]|uniref:CaiB/BaiF CoA transferase family protein n=1 Tax=Quadrisphaera sp. KR29 TaxID=3461391 RepID=UPI004044D46E